VDILCTRIESPSTHAKVGQIDCVTARALAPLGRLLDMAALFFGPNTKGLFLKGREVETEIGDARQDWEFDLALHPSLSGPEGRIAVISNLRVKSEG
jgi:16S rRNA (guanine527-N7)-methyltransferase